MRPTLRPGRPQLRTPATGTPVAGVRVVEGRTGLTFSHDEGQAGIRKRPLLLAVGTAAIAMATPFLPGSLRMAAGTSLAVLVCAAALLIEQRRARGIVYAAGRGALLL